MSTMHGRRRFRRGTEVIEAAFILPILLFLAFGTVEFGYYFYIEHNLQGAAREGARAAVPYHATNSDVTDAVKRIMQSSGFKPEQYKVTTDPSDVSDAFPGEPVSIVVSCSWKEIGIRPLQLIKSEVVLGQVKMRREEAP